MQLGPDSAGYADEIDDNALAVIWNHDESCSPGDHVQRRLQPSLP